MDGGFCMENYKIYVHINKINGKIYIGQTGQENVKDRWDSGWGINNVSRLIMLLINMVGITFNI